LDLAGKISSVKKKLLENEFLHINKDQRKAVFQVEGRLMVLAGAGSGKTTMIINRIANMINYGDAYHSGFCKDPSQKNLDLFEAGCKDGKSFSCFSNFFSFNPISPSNILAVTFTNKAAREIKNRLFARLGATANNIWASTFHSMCTKILKSNCEFIGFSKDFNIYDAEDSKKLMKGCQKSLGFDEKSAALKKCLNAISRAKDKMMGAEAFKSQDSNDPGLEKIAQIYQMYQERLKSSNAMDFDDLIFNTVILFKKFPEILENYRKIFKYIMVDEYQDTSIAQHKLIKLLAGENGNLCIVGDDDQSIYKFRGAAVENILGFDKFYKNVRVIRLEQNYRSTKNILKAANSVIENNLNRRNKVLWTSEEEGKKIRLHTAYSEYDEASTIVNEIKNRIENGKKYSDIAVLYRMTSQSSAIERALARNSIPYKIYGGIRFFDRREIKDLLSYLSVINNPDDEIRLRRIINRPKRLIGERTITLINDVAISNGKSFFYVMVNAGQYDELRRIVVRMSSFVDLIESFIKMHKNNAKISEIYKHVVLSTGYIDYIKDEEDADVRLANIKDLENFIIHFEEEKDGNANLSDFLEEISLSANTESENEDDNFVSLMTVHSAKGLEFPIVFLPGFEEGIFPGTKSMYDLDKIEEERRLAYVAITRAKEEIFFLNSTSRMIFGSTSHNKPSRFLSEISSDAFEITKSKEWKKMSPTQEKPSSNYELKVRSVVSARSFGNIPAAANRLPEEENKSDRNFAPGEFVDHAVFGKGTIISTIPMGEDELLEINFEKTGVKRMMSNLANLQKFDLHIASDLSDI
jgi:DNA helicase-2/ATP-dependent DNA helicase PcrA